MEIKEGPIEKAISAEEYYRSKIKGFRARRRRKKALKKVLSDDWIRLAKEISRSRLIGDQKVPRSKKKQIKNMIKVVRGWIKLLKKHRK